MLFCMQMHIFQYSCRNRISADENTSLIEKPGKHQIDQSGNQYLPKNVTICLLVPP